MASYIGRRKFLATLLGGAAAWPLAARAQQTMPVVGYLNQGSPESDASRLTGLRRGLNQSGYVEGRNFVVEYRWAGNQADRLPALAADLAQLQVTVIVAAGLLPARAARAATTSIPIVFSVGADPVQLGLVASLNRPGGNLTGFNGFVGELGAKGLALLHDLVPGAATIDFLENPNSPIFELTTRDVLAAAPVIGVKVQISRAGTDRELDAAFASLVQARTEALLVGSDVFFNTRVEQLAALAARHTIPTMYSYREFVVAGGLISYGTSLIEQYRQVGLYTGRILKGEKPADLPVMQPRNSSSLSISRPPRHSVSTCRQSCSRSPTRCSNKGLFAALHESAFGTKQTYRDICRLSAFGGKADNICSLNTFSTATTACIVYPPLTALRVHWGISPSV